MGRGRKTATLAAVDDEMVGPSAAVESQAAPKGKRGRQAKQELINATDALLRRGNLPRLTSVEGTWPRVQPWLSIPVPPPTISTRFRSRSLFSFHFGFQLRLHAEASGKPRIFRGLGTVSGFISCFMFGSFGSRLRDTRCLSAEHIGVPELYRVLYAEQPQK
ncbi:hypothetical protein AG1IA_07859 [Rhizoctonia solani AG-1 IA]|uniref:Uncharacterized protein n=1 Tax=Thanatephorus cucumeris (strain AG1-IA) TaxID=983506 RepID=L8WMU9_THACA|nr:hypothetical protein AG1IA_07859 [Rhizoctonia solani AG-1 IA]